jgi:hypothetical protein
MLLSLTYSYYVSPLEAVMMRPSALYRDAGEQYAKALDQPISSGLKVLVLDERGEGKWVKIQTSQGNIGFVPSDALKIL